MIKATYESPTYLEIDGKFLTDQELKQLKALFTFESQKAKYDVKRFRNAHWYRNKHGQPAFQEELERLQSLVDVCLLEEKRNGNFRLLSGLKPYLEKIGLKVDSAVEYPEQKSLACKTKPEHELRYYQKESVEALLGVKHGAIEISTGGGKSSIIQEVLRKTGLKSVVMAPSKQIAEQLFEQLSHTFGEKYVGFFGDGKKNAKKLITVAIGASLTRVTDKSPHFKDFSKVQVFIADEAHVTATETLSKVCCGLLTQTPYRFFVSATQMRNDGSDMLLEGIIGPIVYKKGLTDLVNEGFLAKPNHYVVPVQSTQEYYSDDFLSMAQCHFYDNASVGRTAAKLANMFVRRQGHRVLILLDRTAQFQYIYPHLEFEFGFAHSGTENENVPAQFQDSDVSALVKKFNDGKLPILIGTSCISTGTDTRPVDTLIYLKAGKSEITFRQALGRGTRVVPGKTEFNFIDFDLEVVGLDSKRNMFKRHLEERVGYCEYPVKRLSI